MLLFMAMCRHAKHSHEQQHRELRKRQKRAIDVVLEATTLLLDWPAESAFSKEELWQQVDESKLRGSLVDLRTFQRLEERGYGELLLARYPSLRKYFVAFVHLPFAAKQGNESLLRALEIIRQLDAGTLKKLPTNAPTAFVPKELRRALYDQAAQINRNAWETGLALAIKDALRSGDLYLPQSKQHISFWDLTFNELHWQEVRTTACATLHQPPPREAKAVLTQQFHDATALAQQRFAGDTFAEIQDGKLKLKRYDKVAVAPAEGTFHKSI